MEDSNTPNRDCGQMNVTKLCLSVDNYAVACPGVSRFHVNELVAQLQKTGAAEMSKTEVCSFCGQIFRPGNHHLRLMPRMKLTKKIKQLQNKAKSRSKVLGKYQRNLLKSYTDGYNYLVIKCMSCQKVTKQRMYARSDRTKVVDPETATEVSSKKKKKKRAKREVDAGLSRLGNATPIEKEQSSVSSYMSPGDRRPKPSTSVPASTSMKDVLMKANKKSSKKNSKDSFQKLQKMLSQEQQQKKVKDNAKSLTNFLNSV